MTNVEHQNITFRTFVADFQTSVAQSPNIKMGEEFTGYA